ncbi:MAG TPA: AAA family ATPase [Blastocatellia bacterium]|nr:AAA family ATPase [Blastocatellia bacterium]
MYQQFYKLNDIPFSLAPDPKYLFRTESLLEVFANLQYGIEHGKGIVVVTGEVGAGKTTVLRSMLQSLDRSVLAAYIFNPLLSTEEFFDLLAGEFRLRPQQSKASMLRLLGYVLMSRHAQGLRTVLVIDEAHLLPPHLLEEIRLLSNFETNREKLLQIILCGQPELHDLLAQPELRQFKQCVGLKCSIKMLTLLETSEYIRWRLQVAGAKDVNLFEPQSIRMIHQFSSGIPRIINNICDNALLTGFSRGEHRIVASIINEAVEELDLTSMEIISAPTVAESVVERSAHQKVGSQLQSSRDSSQPSSTNREPSNVRYIRREIEESIAADDEPRFVINSESKDDAQTPLRFFSRVRVTRNS